MNYENLLLYFKNLIIGLGIEGVNERSIFLPNELEDRAGKSLWFTLCAVPGDPVNEQSEYAERRPLAVNVAVKVPLGTGLGRGCSAAAAIEKCCVPFDFEKGAFAVDGVRYYVQDVTLGEPEVNEEGGELSVRFGLVSLRGRISAV